MDIKSGQAEQHETPLPIDSTATPAVVAPSRVWPSGNEQMGPTFISTAGVDFTADAAAAMHAGMAADADRRGRYATTMSPLGASYGDALPVVEYGASGATVAGSWFDPPRSGTPADTA